MGDGEKTVIERIDEIIVSMNGEEAGRGAQHSSQATSIRLSEEMIEKARVLARLHGARGYQTWLKQIIEERINLEFGVVGGLRGLQKTTPPRQIENIGGAHPEGF